MVNINELIDAHIEKTNLERSKTYTRKPSRFWPTDASVVVNGKVIHKCKRQLYYRFIGAEESNRINARGLKICDAGNNYEDIEIKRTKDIGLFKDTQVHIEFNIPDTEITIAGKVDMVYNIDGKIIGGEVKTGYGYMFQSQVFDKSIPGMPMIKHLMQVMMYLYYFKNFNKYDYDIDEFYMIYIDRGDCSSRQFSIKLTDDNYPIINGRKMINIHTSNGLLFNQNPDGKREVNRINKIYDRIKDNEFCVENIFERFKMIDAHVKEKKLPSKDFKYCYTDEEVEAKYAAKEISKARYTDWTKGTMLKDFECAYCPFLKKCINDDGIKFNDLINT